MNIHRNVGTKPKTSGNSDKEEDRKRRLLETSPEENNQRLKMVPQKEQLAIPVTKKDIAQLLQQQTEIIRKEIEVVHRKIMEEIQAKVDALEAKVDSLQIKNDHLNEKNKRLEDRLESSEREAKKNNVVITGMQAENATEAIENFKGLTKRICGEELTIKNVRMFETRNGIKKIVGQLDSMEQKMRIMKKKRELIAIDKRVFLDDDLTREEQNVQKKAREVCDSLRKEGRSTRAGYRKICVDGKWMGWNRETGCFDAEPFRRRL